MLIKEYFILNWTNLNYFIFRFINWYNNVKNYSHELYQ